MKISVYHFFQTVLALALVLSIGCAERFNPEVEKRLLSLLEEESYFELNREYTAHRMEASSQTRLLVEAHLFYTFNNNHASLQSIDQLLNDQSYILNDSVIITLRGIEAQNHLMLFNYSKALEINNLLLTQFKSSLDNLEIEDLNTMSNIYRPLVNTGVQKVIIPDDELIPIHRDKIGYMNVDTKIKGNNYKFIFDTGAGMSVIKKSLAEELGYEILETRIDVKSASEKVIESSLAVIDTLKIGGITVINSVFLVMEDEMLEFPQVDFYPLAIIGFPIIEEFGEVTISKDETLKIRASTSKGKSPNMRLESLSPIVYLFNGTDTLEYAFDTGAQKSHLTLSYFEKYQQKIELAGSLDTINSASAGGTQSVVVYTLPELDLTIGSNKAVLNDISVYTEESITFDDVYGNLGQDLIGQFDEMTLDFRNMTIEFK